MMKHFIFYICSLILLGAAIQDGVKPHAPTPFDFPFYLMNEELNVPPDNPMTVEGIALGRLLFYEKLLSANGSYSCGSCHQQSLAFTDGQRRAIGYLGDTLERNTMSLLNLAWQSEFFWDGSVKTLEELIQIPIVHPKEMGQDTATLVSLLQKHEYYPEYFHEAFGSRLVSFSRVSMALAQFLRSIYVENIHLPDSVLNIPPEGVSEHDFVMSQLYDDSYRALYFRLADMCGSCHSTQVYGGTKLNFNMVNDSLSLMKVPTLVNIGKSGPYMHDGRFETLQEVLDHYDSHISTLVHKDRKGGEAPVVTELTDFDRANALRFFEYFEDSSLLTNPQWSDPFSNGEFKWLESVSQY